MSSANNEGNVDAGDAQSSNGDTTNTGNNNGQNRSGRNHQNRRGGRSHLVFKGATEGIEDHVFLCHAEQKKKGQFQDAIDKIKAWA